MQQRSSKSFFEVWTTVPAVAALLLLVVPIVGVFVFRRWVILPVLEEAPVATTVSYVLEEIPRQAEFYFFVAGLVGIVLVWRWSKYVQLRAEGSEPASGNVREHVGLALRRRAVVLRTRADLTLLGAFLLLVAGVYFNIFVLREISGTDASRIAQAQIASEFGTRLQCIVEGRCMFEVVQNTAQVAQRANVLERQPFLAETVDTVTGRVFSADRGSLGDELSEPLVLGEELHSIGFSADGRSGIILGNRGSVWVTTDGQAGWSRVPPRWGSREKFYVHGVSADGKAGIVAGDGGSIWIAGDGLTNWRPSPVQWKERESTAVAVLSRDGRTGLLVGTQGSVWVSRNIMSASRNISPTWWRAELPREMEGTGYAAALSANGRIGIVASDAGPAFLSKNGLANWSPVELPRGWGEGARIVALDADGRGGDCCE